MGDFQGTLGGEATADIDLFQPYPFSKNAPQLAKDNGYMNIIITNQSKIGKGLIGSKFAAKYPACVSALYLDAPVMNLLSCPVGLEKAMNRLLPEFMKAIGMDLPQLLCYRKHPHN